MDFGAGDAHEGAERDGEALGEHAAPAALEGEGVAPRRVGHLGQVRLGDTDGRHDTSQSHRPGALSALGTSTTVR